MAVTESVKVDIRKSLNKSLDEVEKIKSGKLPKRSYKDMISRVRKQLDDEK